MSRVCSTCVAIAIVRGDTLRLQTLLADGDAAATLDFPYLILPFSDGQQTEIHELIPPGPYYPPGQCEHILPNPTIILD